MTTVETTAIAPEEPVPEVVKAPHKALTMLVHGPSKVGKSLLAASLPKPLVYFDVESAARFLPLRARVWDPLDPPPIWTKESTWDTAVVPVRDWSTALQALDWLKMGQHNFRGVSVDSVSELQYRALESIAGRAQMKIQDWGEVLRVLGGFVRDLRDLTMHPTNPISAVLLTAMSFPDQNEGGLMRPYLQGQMKVQIPYLMDVTAYLQIAINDQGQEVRQLLTRRRGNKEAGERVNGKIPPVLELADITGNTVADVAAKNKTFQGIMRRVFRDDVAMVQTPKAEAPAPAAEAAAGNTAAAELAKANGGTTPESVVETAEKEAVSLVEEASGTTKKEKK